MAADTPTNAWKAKRAIHEARARKLTIATAESCTAGGLACLLADAPGASEVFHGGFVAYTKDQKTAGLGIPRPVIDEHAAVSVAVARAMAQGALERSPADLVISITGVLGPEPDEDGNPVGLVYIGLAKRDGYVHVHEDHLHGRAKSENYEVVLAKALILLEEGLTTIE